MGKNEQSVTEKIKGMLKEQSIADIINETLTSMATIRVNKTLWVDDCDNEKGGNGSGLMKTAEALEAIFTPAIFLIAGNENEVETEEKKIVKNINWTTVDEDIETIIKTVGKEGWSGSPYLEQYQEFTELFGTEDPYKKGETDFVDAVSFVTTTLLDYLVCSHIYRVGDSEKEKYFKPCRDIICEGVHWLVDNKGELKKDGERIGVYWPIGTSHSVKQIPGLYFTYSAIVALTWVLDGMNKGIGLDSDTRIDEKALKDIVKDCYRWAKNRVIKSPDDDNMVVHMTDFGRAETMGASVALVYILLIFETCEAFLSEGEAIDKMLVEDIVTTLNNLYEGERKSFYEGQFAHIISFFKDVKERRISYEDLTIYFLLLEALCWAYKFLKNIDPSGKEIGRLKKNIDLMIKDILEKRNSTKRLWDNSWKQDEKSKYQIYFNQRALEALIYYKYYVGEFYAGGILITKGKIESAINEVWNEISKDLRKKLIAEIWNKIQ